MCRIHHAAIAVKEFDAYVELFEALDMTVRKRAGEAPHRQVWFYEGIQLNEKEDAQTGTAVDHIALAAPDIEAAIRTAEEHGCTRSPRGKNWFALPNGVIIEMMQE